MAVRSSERGVELRLMDQMCMDRHVPDFLLCLECWLRRSFGEPVSTGRPWKLSCLDLSRNGLGHESACSVFATLKRFDVRVDRLLLAGNRFGAQAITVLTDVIWHNPEAMLEVDLADNDIFADPRGEDGAAAGGDVISALLRCFYNHPAYPAQSGKKSLPLIFRFSGNRVLEPKRLLKNIQAKGGKDHVRICKDMEPYSPSGREFLSLYAADFTKQRQQGEELPDDAFQ